jgi:hypothetical protein
MNVCACVNKDQGGREGTVTNVLSLLSNTHRRFGFAGIIPGCLSSLIG